MYSTDWVQHDILALGLGYICTLKFSASSVCVCVCVRAILALLVVSIFQMARYVAGSVGPIAIFLPTHSLYYKEDPLGWGNIIWDPMLVD